MNCFKTCLSQNAREKLLGKLISVCSGSFGSFQFVILLRRFVRLSRS